MMNKIPQDVLSCKKDLCTMQELPWGIAHCEPSQLRTQHPNHLHSMLMPTRVTCCVPSSPGMALDNPGALLQLPASTGAPFCHCQTGCHTLRYPTLALVDPLHCTGIVTQPQQPLEPTACVDVVLDLEGNLFVHTVSSTHIGHSCRTGRCHPMPEQH